MPEKLYIEIVRSSLVELSSMSLISAQAIQNSLKKKYAMVGLSVVDNLDDLKNLVAKKPDLVFLGMEYVYNNVDRKKIWISDFLDRNDINYTGSSKFSHKLGRNKISAKNQISDAGYNTAKHKVVKSGHNFSESEMIFPFPVFIKPTNKGGGTGIDSNSLAFNLEQVNLKINEISSVYQTDSLVEEYLSGREFSVAILKNKSSDIFSVLKFYQTRCCPLRCLHISNNPGI